MKFVFLLLLLLIFAPGVHAVVIGVNKVSLEFNDVLRNGYAENTFIVSSGSTQSVAVYYEARGAIADWIRFEPVEKPVFVFNDNPQIIKVIVEPPSDARVDSYNGKILVYTGPLGEVKGNMGAAVEVAYELNVDVKITDTQIISCGASGFDLLDAEINKEIPFFASFYNGGNVRLKPEFVVEVYDQFQENLLTTFNVRASKDVLPTMSERIENFINHELEPGQYWAFISEPVCGSSKSTLTFNILERGGISERGEIVRIENANRFGLGEVVPINVYFRNTGERVVSAQFKGVITSGGRVVDVINSDVLDVAPNEVSVFEMLYPTKEEGQFLINGRVYFNNKITFEKGSIFNVEAGYSSLEKESDYLLAVVLSIIVIFIGVVLFLILRRKKRRKKHLRF